MRKTGWLVGVIAVAVVACGGARPRAESSVGAEEESERPRVAPEVELARALLLKGRDVVYCIGPIKGVADDSAGRSAVVRQFLARLTQAIVQEGGQVLAADRLTDILAQHKMNLTDLFTSNGQAKINDFSPARVVILGEINNKNLFLRAIDMQSAVIMRAGSVSLEMADTNCAKDILEMAYYVPQEDRLRMIAKYVVSHKCVLTAEEYGDLARLCSSDDRAKLYDIVQDQGLLKL